LPGHRAVACSGSLPPGAPLDAYAQLADVAHHHGVPVLVDCAPGPLAACLPAGPDLVAPNLQEAEAAITGDVGHLLVDADTDVRARACAAASALLDRGARAAAVTAGAHGVALAERGAGEVRWWPTVPVDVVSTVGAGDAFLGGVLVDVESQPGGPVSWRRAVLRGSATASASCEQLTAGGVDPQRAQQLHTRLEKHWAATEADDARR
jgi:fructose-1-phosphate kinase PfkB-like protein